MLVTEALKHAEEATAELRELAHGILPSVLTRGGLRAGVVALASRMPVPVDIGVSVDRFPAAVEATAYFVVAEALTNVAKHAHARHATVTAHVEDGALRVQVRDDGIGGARRGGGSGLIGLADRVAALDGELRIESPAATGTPRLRDAMAFAEGQRGHELGFDAPHELLRSVEGVSGRVAFVMELAPRPEYGLVMPLIRLEDGGARTFGAGRLAVRSAAA